MDENEHDIQIKKEQDENPIPKSVAKLEDLCDLKDRFKKVTNSKTHSSTLRFDLVNLGTDEKPQNVNPGLSLSSKEILSFIRLFRMYKSVFAWDYIDLKTYDTFVIQHMIPMISKKKSYTIEIEEDSSKSGESN